MAEDLQYDLPDSQIVDRAQRERRTVVTFDQDFGRLLAFAGAVSPSVVILRLEDQTKSVRLSILDSRAGIIPPGLTRTSEMLRPWESWYRRARP